MSRMRARSSLRRQFIALFGCAAAWPPAGHAQEARHRRVDVLIAFPVKDPNTQAYVTALAQALGRAVATRVVAQCDVPGFDRSSVDGFALRAEDTIGAAEREPRRLTLLPEILTPGHEPLLTIEPGTATLIEETIFRAVVTPTTR